MNIQQLEYLLAVDKFKHFGKAAQACYITQPTLSAMTQKLEEELDVKIFDRTTHPIRTTDIGREIVEKARKILDSVNDLKETANMLNSVLGGKITIGVIPTVSNYILPLLIFDFLKINEKVELSIKELSTENIVKSLKSGEIDAGIISTPYEAASDFSHSFLFNEELMVYSSEDKQDTYITPSDIDFNKVWLLEDGNCLRTQFENICHLKESSLKPKNLNFEASNIGTLIQMVDTVGGVTIIPELATHQLSEEQKQKVVRFRNPFPYREISMIYYKPTYKQRIIDELVAFIQNILSDKLNYNNNPKDFVGVKPQ